MSNCATWRPDPSPAHDTRGLSPSTR